MVVERVIEKKTYITSGDEIPELAAQTGFVSSWKGFPFPLCGTPCGSLSWLAAASLLGRPCPDPGDLPATVTDSECRRSLNSGLRILFESVRREDEEEEAMPLVARSVPGALQNMSGITSLVGCFSAP